MGRETGTAGQQFEDPNNVEIKVSFSSGKKKRHRIWKGESSEQLIKEINEYLNESDEN
ncbi:MAG: hypothetical protein AAF824_03445 [Bacteroidota bacterium]